MNHLNFGLLGIAADRQGASFEDLQSFAISALIFDEEDMVLGGTFGITFLGKSMVSSAHKASMNMKGISQ